MGYEDNPQLANWVSTQRQEWKLFKSKKPSRLTQEKINILNKVNFVWEAQRGGARARSKTKRSKASNMNKNRKKSKVASTSTAICSQQNSINVQQSQSKSLTPVDMSKNAENKSFDFEQDHRPWISIFKDYLWFLDQSRNPEEIPALRQWAMNQREEYKRQKSINPNFMLHNESSKLTLDQFNLLQSINFDWNYHLHHDINMTISERQTSSQLEDVGITAATTVGIPHQLESSSNSISLDEMSMHRLVNCHSDSTDSSGGQDHVLDSKKSPCSSMNLSTRSAGAKIEADAAEALFSLCAKK